MVPPSHRAQTGTVSRMALPEEYHSFSATANGGRFSPKIKQDTQSASPVSICVFCAICGSILLFTFGTTFHFVDASSGTRAGRRLQFLHIAVIPPSTNSRAPVT